MTALADGDPLALSELTPFQTAGRAHVEQVSVLPDDGRRGVGRRLLDAADSWAGQHGLVALTLTTYAEVPWNAPYYGRLGFEVLSDTDLTPGLRRVREREEAAGLAAWPRVAMRCPVLGDRGR